ncbi:MAG: magnesium-translocating P-type ATPase [Bacteroidetes bacterium]|nr:magnesium-translocating P-type ATPase [Bacteroidota bacterium]
MDNKDQTPGLDRFWSLRKDEVLSRLLCNTAGLSDAEAGERLKKYGPNAIKSKKRVSAVLLFLSQFKSPITILLIAAALLSAGLQDITDAVIILVIVVISSTLSFWQEYGAANAVQELLKLVQIRCAVLRGAQKKEVPLETVVPGDIISLSAGDIIPGDSMVLESEDLFVDEAAFTGETYPVEKESCIVPANTVLAKRRNTLFMGSHVISGKATAAVVRTGKSTEFGKISEDLQIKAPETDFERGIRRFGYMLMEVTLLLVIVIFAINVYLHKPVLDSFMFSLALAVGLTPQLLPAIISVNLSAGARRMAKKRVIVKRLSSIENFGSMNVLCSDKTGTITEGKVKLKDTLDITGAHSDKVLQYAWLNASLQQGFRNPIDDAICAANTVHSGKFELQAEIPYDFIRKRLTTQVTDGSESIAITKGALNAVLDICDQAETSAGILSIKDCHEQLTKKYQELSNAGFRTLGVAYRKTDPHGKFTREDERQMTFLGFVALFDPPKAGIDKTLNDLSRLGVSLKVITGDNALVAKSLAVQVGIKEPNIITGAEMQKMTNAALVHRAPRTDIFAEVEPNQKERIIATLKKAGYVVGFMGDGINDAPALHTADVGISVDTAVDVAKEAAEIVLLSRSLGVLADGIVEGRKTFTNTMKYIFMATSANFGNMFSMAGASLIMPFLPLLPKQILLTNLLQDFPEMAIATDRVDEVNISSPQKWDLRFIRRFMIIFGLLSSVFDYLTFGVLIFFLHADEKIFQTGWFTESVISAVLIVLVVRTKLSFFKSPPGKILSIATVLVLIFVLSTPLLPVAGWLGFGRLPLAYYGWMSLIVALYLLSAELTKHWFYKRLHK